MKNNRFGFFKKSIVRPKLGEFKNKDFWVVLLRINIQNFVFSFRPPDFYGPVCAVIRCLIHSCTLSSQDLLDDLLSAVTERSFQFNRQEYCMHTAHHIQSRRIHPLVGKLADGVAHVTQPVVPKGGKGERAMEILRKRDHSRGERDESTEG